MGFRKVTAQNHWTTLEVFTYIFTCISSENGINLLQTMKQICDEDNITIPPKLMRRRLFLPCLSISDDATAVPVKR